MELTCFISLCSFLAIPLQQLNNLLEEKSEYLFAKMNRAKQNSHIYIAVFQNLISYFNFSKGNQPISVRKNDCNFSCPYEG